MITATQSIIGAASRLRTIARVRPNSTTSQTIAEGLRLQTIRNISGDSRPGKIKDIAGEIKNAVMCMIAGVIAKILVCH
jgi:hypothetical protein